MTFLITTQRPLASEGQSGQMQSLPDLTQLSPAQKDELIVALWPMGLHEGDLLVPTPRKSQVFVDAGAGI